MINTIFLRKNNERLQLNVTSKNVSKILIFYRFLLTTVEPNIYIYINLKNSLSNTFINFGLLLQRFRKIKNFNYINLIKLYYYVRICMYTCIYVYKYIYVYTHMYYVKITNFFLIFRLLYRLHYSLKQIIENNTRYLGNKISPFYQKLLKSLTIFL